MIRILKIVSVELEISFYRQFTYFSEQKQILRQEELTENVGSFLCILTIKKVYNVNEVLQYVKKDVFRMWVNIFKFPLVVLIAVTCVGFGTISFITAKNALYSNMGKTLPEISASSEEMNSSTEEVAAAAQSLSGMTTDMMQEVNKFKL